MTECCVRHGLVVSSNGVCPLCATRTASIGRTRLTRVALFLAPIAILALLWVGWNQAKVRAGSPEPECGGRATQACEGPLAPSLAHTREPTIEDSSGTAPAMPAGLLGDEHEDTSSNVEDRQLNQALSQPRTRLVPPPAPPRAPVDPELPDPDDPRDFELPQSPRPPH
jgi:hypothetical protein